MGKTKNCDKEYNREQRLVHENQNLKKQIKSLRKQLKRGTISSGEEIPEVEEIEEETAEVPQRVCKEDWICKKCGDGHLVIIKYPKAGETWYFRKCNNCPHRTVGKPYTSEVKGLEHGSFNPDDKDNS